jgi:hypothetical protein
MNLIGGELGLLSLKAKVTGELALLMLTGELTLCKGDPTLLPNDVNLACGSPCLSNPTCIFLSRPC